MTATKAEARNLPYLKLSNVIPPQLINSKYFSLNGQTWTGIRNFKNYILLSLSSYQFCFTSFLKTTSFKWFSVVPLLFLFVFFECFYAPSLFLIYEYNVSRRCIYRYHKIYMTTRMNRSKVGSMQIFFTVYCRKKDHNFGGPAIRNDWCLSFALDERTRMENVGRKKSYNKR